MVCRSPMTISLDESPVKVRRQVLTAPRQMTRKFFTMLGGKLMIGFPHLSPRREGAFSRMGAVAWKEYIRCRAIPEWFGHRLPISAADPRRKYQQPRSLPSLESAGMAPRAFVQ